MKTAKKLLITFLAFLTFALVGCAGTPYTYHVEPTPLKQGTSTYYLNKVDVNLTLGHGAIPGDTSFAAEKELVGQFTNSLNNSLKDKGIFASNSSDADAELDIKIDYKRIYNWGGKALNKPEVTHFVIVKRGKEKLATLGRRYYTTKYAYFDDVAVNLEIASFNWGADDELRDIDLISNLIIEDLYKVGE